MPAIALGTAPILVAVGLGNIDNGVTNIARLGLLSINQVGLDLSGTIIYADNSVALSSGNSATFIPVRSYAANPLMQQLLSVDEWGTHFVTVPFATRTGGGVGYRPIPTFFDN